MPVIATNTSANTALIYLNKNSSDQSKSLAKLSSGTRIVRASDDAAGLAVATRLKANSVALDQSARNAVQARAVLQTADGALARVGDILQRMKALAAQSISGSVDNTSRGFINQEYTALGAEIDAIETSTTFNGQALIDGTYNQNFFVGVSATTDVIAATLTTVNVDTTSIMGAAIGSIATSAGAVTEAGKVDTAINAISGHRATVGALISRFEYRGDYVESAKENLSAAASSILDVDIAAEQSNLVSKQVLTEAAIAALSQANQMKSSLLSLVR